MQDLVSEKNSVQEFSTLLNESQLAKGETMTETGAELASFPGHTHFSMLHAEKGEGLVHEVTCKERLKRKISDCRP